jgi:hypothetical protein
MDLMERYLDVDTVIRLLTFGIFGFLGFDLSKNIPRPRNTYFWFVMIVAILLGGFLGIQIPLVVICGFEIYLRMILLGSCFGFVTGFIVRMFPTLKFRKF